ncbi:alpha/beta-hydrolase [Trametes elegans]|nr:alpha/beta-hydrolase [Trametes elegans]
MRFLSTASVACAASFLVLSVTASPTLSTRSVTKLSSKDLAAFAPYTHFAAAAYCGSDKVTNWDCGDACDAITGFTPILTGGDGDGTQYYFVGFWADQNAVVVAHEGTDPTAFLSDLTDVDLFLKGLDDTLFPGVPDSVQVHEGFANQHAKTAPDIMAAVNKIISENGAKTVITVGHSLGGALAELDSLYFTMNLPSSIHIKAVTYGTPRVGNPAYATMFDSKVSDFVRINNEDDPVPIVPGRGLGFQHPHGEIHIVQPGDAVSCPGDDDATDTQCTISTVPNVVVGDILDHLGPYEGIYIGTIFC